MKTIFIRFFVVTFLIFLSAGAHAADTDYSGFNPSKHIKRDDALRIVRTYRDQKNFLIKPALGDDEKAYNSSFLFLVEGKQAGERWMEELANDGVDVIVHLDKTSDQLNNKVGRTKNNKSKKGARQSHEKMTFAFRLDRERILLIESKNLEDK